MSLKKKQKFLKVNARMVTCVFCVSIRQNNGLGVTRAGRGARAAYIDCYLLIIVKSPCKTTQYNNNASATGPSPRTNNQHNMYMYSVRVYQG